MRSKTSKTGRISLGGEHSAPTRSLVCWFTFGYISVCLSVCHVCLSAGVNVSAISFKFGCRTVALLRNVKFLTYVGQGGKLCRNKMRSEPRESTAEREVLCASFLRFHL